MRFEKICFHIPILTLSFALSACAQQAGDASTPQMDMPMGRTDEDGYADACSGEY